MLKSNLETATLAGGCFWCTEAIFKRLKGVASVVPGYIGGVTQNPTYEEVCSGKTGHAEAIQITFDPQIITYEKLLDVFWHLHDPTTLNRQGADEGALYRSAVFYHNEGQKQKAERIKQKIEKQRLYAKSLVTEIVPFDKFYPAESYHKNYYYRNREAGYCTYVIDPKIQKLMKEYEKDVNININDKKTLV